MLSTFFFIIYGCLLSAATGIRAFLPLVVISYAHINGLFGFSTALEDDLFHFPVTLIVLGCLAILEMVLDAFPFISLLNKFFLVPAKSVAGTGVAYETIHYMFPNIDFLAALFLAVVTGGFFSVLSNLGVSALRAIGEAGSIGMASPVMSFLEDALAFLLSISGIFLVGKALALVVSG